MEATFEQSLHAILLEIISNRSKTPSATQKELELSFLSKSACLPALANILVSSTHPGVTFLAAMNLREYIPEDNAKLWTDLSKTDRDVVKSKLFEFAWKSQGYLKEACYQIITAIAVIDIPQAKWDGLFPFLCQACAARENPNRETASRLLFDVLKALAPHSDLKIHLPCLFPLFIQLLGEPLANIQLSIISSIGVVAQEIECDDHISFSILKEFIPHILRNLSQSLANGNGEYSSGALSVLEIFFSLESPVLDGNITSTFELLFSYGTNQETDDKIRSDIFCSLERLFVGRKSDIERLSLMRGFLKRFFFAMCETDPLIANSTAYTSTLALMCRMGRIFSPSQVFHTLHSLILPYFNAPVASRRCGALISLSTAIEECHDLMLPRMDEVWAVIEAGLQDPHEAVRRAGCITISCLSEIMPEQCASKHVMLVPSIIHLIKQGRPFVEGAACNALKNLLEIIPNFVYQHSHLILAKLTGLITGAITMTASASVLETISLSAQAMQEEFSPYFNPVMREIINFLSLIDNAEHSHIYASIMDVITSLAKVVGKVTFRSQCAKVMHIAIQRCAKNDSVSTKSSFSFFGFLAQFFGEEFASSLRDIVPLLLIALKPDLDCSQCDCEKHSQHQMKIVAIETIGELFKATKAYFLAFVKPCIKAILATLPDPHEEIRSAATETLLVIIQAFDDLRTPQAGIVSAIGPVSNGHLMIIIHEILPPLLNMFTNETSKLVVTSLCQGLTDTIIKVGLLVLVDSGYQMNFLNIASQVLEGRSFCQRTFEGEGESDDEADSDGLDENELELLASARDLLSLLQRMARLLRAVPLLY